MSHSKKLSQKPKAKNLLPKIRYIFDAIGTSWTIDLFTSLSSRESEDLQKQIHDRIAEFDENYSRFRGDSLVSQMAKKAGQYTLPHDAKPMFDLYEQLYMQTDGMMTPLIGDTLVDAGYDAEYSLKARKLTSPNKWEDVIEYDFPNIALKHPVLLDLGAAGKGYLVDIVGQILETNSVHDFCINAGGDIVYKTTSKDVLEIALEHPEDPELAIGVASIRDQSLCGSAGNRRKWSTFHHIINPKTLESPHNIRALWVVAGSGLLSDALSTALFFTPAHELMKYYNFEYALIHEDYSLEHSDNFPAIFYTNKRVR